MNLAMKECVPYVKNIPVFNEGECRNFQENIHSSWELVDKSSKLRRKFNFNDFSDPFHLAIDIGNLAETQQHHPDIKLGWGYLEVEIWTHSAQGLVESDFILAAKIDRLAEEKGL